MLIRGLLLSSFLVIVSACGLISDDRPRMQSILIETPYTKEAKCEIMDAHTNRWVIKKTPKLLAIQSGHPPLTIFCRKDGYKDTAVKVDDYVKELNDLKQLPLVLEEVMGAGFDPYATIWSKYPDHIKVWMEPEQWSSEQFQRQWAYEREVYNKEQMRIMKEREERRKKSNNKNKEGAKSSWSGAERGEGRDEYDNSYDSFSDFFKEMLGYDEE